MHRDVEFGSRGVTVRGLLLTPDRSPGPHPTLVMAGGWCYVKEIVMPHYAQPFLDAGIACLLFDYRGFGASDGAPRQHLDPWAQIEDYRNAISFALTLPEVDRDRLGVWGISYSGGHVVVLAATDPRIRCAVSNIPVVDGLPNMQRVHGERLFRRLLKAVADDREHRFANPAAEPGRIAMSTTDPEHELSTWPFPDVHQIFNQLKATEAPRHEHWSTLESVELLMQYQVMPFARRILDLPILMVVARDDDKTLWDLQIEVFNSIPSPAKELLLLPNVTHMSLYNTKSHLEIAAGRTTEWLRAALIGENRPALVS